MIDPVSGLLREKGCFLEEASKEIRIINVTGENSGETSARRWAIPREVVVERPNRLKVTIEKLLYTKSGWEKVIITMVYERFTNVL